MSSLPVELLHAIARNITYWRDVGRFRLCCKEFAAVGINYLLPDGKLTTVIDHRGVMSLLQIAAHPVLSKCVQSLVIKAYPDDHQLDIHIVRWKCHSLIHLAQDLVASAAPKMIYDCEQLRSQEIRPRGVSDFYRQYMDNFQVWGQSGLVNRCYMMWHLAICRFTKLKSISLVCWGAPRLPWEFSDTCRDVIAGTSDMYIASNNFTNLEQLLLTVISAEVKLETLCINLIDWQICKKCPLACPVDVLFKSMKHLTTLRLNMYTGCATEESGYFVSNCREAMSQEGNLRRAILHLDQLEVLHVRMDAYMRDEDIWPANVEDVLDPQGHWPHLKDLALQCMQMTADSFTTFVARHTQSLKILELMTIFLDSSWLDLWPHIQANLNLEEAVVLGDFFGVVPSPHGDDEDCRECWHAWPSDASGLHQKFSRWLVDGGTCPLTSRDIKIFPMFE